jgi:hypothetical protein
MSGLRRRTPDWLVERLAAGELPEDRAAEVRAFLAAEPDGQARLEAIAESNRSILQSQPPAAMADAVRARARRRGRGLLVLAPVTAVAAVAAVVALGGRPGTRPGDDSGREPTRVKGTPSLVIHRQRDLAIERVAPGATVRERDLLQVAYQAAGRSHGVVLSIDGAGKVTRHFPTSGVEAGRLASGGLVSLPDAFELDDAPEFERFFFVTSRSPFAMARVLDAARSLGQRPETARSRPLDLPAGLEQTSFLLRKADQ